MFNIKYSIVSLCILFVITFLIHKPFDIHKYKNKLIQFIHYSLEVLFTIQLVILVLQLLSII